MKVAFFDIKPFEKEFLEQSLTSDFEAFYYQTSLNPATKIDDEIKDAEALSVFVESNLTEEVLSKFDKLKTIVLRSVGYSHVDIIYAKKRNIKIYNAPHYGDHSIAEYTFALLLSILRKIIQSSKDVKKQTINNDKYRGMELCGKTIGIIGLGATGKIVADISQGFSMKPVYFDIQKDERYNYLPLNDLCKVSDIISINCPLNQNTLYLIDESKFSLMKNGVVIVNTGRGEIIKTRALLEALLSKKVSYAALDVVESEDLVYENLTNRIDINTIKDPCFKNYYMIRKIMSMENVIITPHIAYNTTEAQKRILEITVGNLISSTKFTS